MQFSTLRVRILLWTVLLLLISPQLHAQQRTVTVGGWGGVVLADDDRPNVKPGFDIYAWYLYIQAHPADGYTFFGEVEFEHGPELSADTLAGKLVLERLYMERNFSTANNIRVGKFFLPFGYWYLSHWSFLSETYSYPYSFENNWVPRFQAGVQYFGRAFRGESSLNYYAWVGNGPDLYGTNSRSVEEPGWGGSVFAEHRFDGRYDRNLGFVVGIHGQTVQLVTQQKESQFNTVFGVKGRYGRVEVRGETYMHYRQHHPDYSSNYLNGLFWLVNDKFGLNVRHDMGDNLELTQSWTSASHEARSTSFGFVWRPEAVVLIKGEYRVNKFEKGIVAPYNQWNLFFGMKF